MANTRLNGKTHTHTHTHVFVYTHARTQTHTHTVPSRLHTCVHVRSRHMLACHLVCGFWQGGGRRAARHAATAAAGNGPVTLAAGSIVTRHAALQRQAAMCSLAEPVPSTITCAATELHPRQHRHRAQQTTHDDSHAFLQAPTMRDHSAQAGGSTPLVQAH